MEFELSAGVLIRAGAALLYTAVGAFILVVGRGSPRNRALGAFFLASSVSLLIANLTSESSQERANLALGVASAFGLVAVLAAALLARHEVSHLPGRHGLMRACVAAVVGLLAAGTVLFFLGRGDIDKDSAVHAAGPTVSWLYFSLFAAFWSTLALGVIAIVEGLRHGLPAGRRAAIGQTLLAANLGSQVAFVAGSIWSAHARVTNLASLGFALLMGAGLLAALWGLRATAGPHGRRGRDLVLVLAACGVLGVLAGSLLGVEARAQATGLLRVVMFLPLAVAVFRFDVLGLQVRRRTLRAGTIASLALGALFVTAQIAQNFVNDTLGLYLGGAVAGVLVLAAYPLQRAAERRIGNDPKAEQSFRDAVAIAMRDRRLDHDEERQLVVLAHGLGIAPDRAYAILAEGGARR